METNKPRNLQDEFLSKLRDEQTPVSVFLVNGIKLNGTVDSFDTYTVFIKNGATQAVFKHAISTILPAIGAHHHKPEAPHFGIRQRREY